MNERDDPPDRPQSILHELFAGADVSATSQALDQAATRAREHGFVVLALGAAVAGSLRELVDLHAAIALQCLRQGRPAAPTAIVSGGAAWTDGPRAGPAEFLLALALAADEHRAIYACACGQWGKPDELAGRGLFLYPNTLARALQLKINIAERLAAGEAESVFEQLGDRESIPSSGTDERVLRAILITQE